MDFADIAQEREQLDRELILAEHANHDPGLPFIGVCHNCEASVPNGMKFCDRDCRDDYAARKHSESLR